MAALDFPASPTVGSTYSPASGVTYTWSGTMWLASGGSPGGDFCATQGYPGTNVGPTFTTMKPPVISGNSGVWYVVGTGRYTPPAGRYVLYADVSANTSAAATYHIGVNLRKNGTAIQDNYCGTGSTWYGQPSVSLILDANGSDWFDAQYLCDGTTTTVESYTFYAYPISGIKGPTGDAGTPPSGIPQNIQTGAYTTVLADAGKHIFHSSGAAAANWTIPANASVPYELGTTLTFVNQGSTISLYCTTDTLILTPAGTTTQPLTLVQYGMATAMKVSATVWFINGVGLS